MIQMSLFMASIVLWNRKLDRGPMSQEACLCHWLIDQVVLWIVQCCPSWGQHQLTSSKATMFVAHTAPLLLTLAPTTKTLLASLPRHFHTGSCCPARTLPEKQKPCSEAHKQVDFCLKKMWTRQHLKPPPIKSILVIKTLNVCVEHVWPP